jgi:hypothetical protein
MPNGKIADVRYPTTRPYSTNPFAVTMAAAIASL